MKSSDLKVLLVVALGIALATLVNNKVLHVEQYTASLAA